MFWPILFGGMFALLILGIVCDVRRAQKQKILDEYHETNWEQTNRGLNTTNLETAKDALRRLEDGYADVREYVSDLNGSCYREDIAEVRENVVDLIIERWEKRASAYIDDFLNFYELISDNSAADRETVLDLKKKCLSKYDAYWRWTEETYKKNVDHLRWNENWVNATRMFKDVFDMHCTGGDKAISFCGHRWDQLTRDQIDARLTACIEAMKPVSNEKTVPIGRIELLSEGEADMLKNKKDVLADSVVQYLREKHLEYIDKTYNGGSIYFFDEGAAAELKEAGYSIQFATNGTRSTNKRPAWYLKLN